MNVMKFWAEHPNILLSDLEIIPSLAMSWAEKLNAITRFSVLLSLVCFAYNRNYRYLYIAVMTAIITVLLFTFAGSEPFQPSPKNKQCRRPTPSNPFMNPLIGERPADPPCLHTDPGVAEEVEKHFNEGLFRNVTDVWDRENSQRQFYTIPGGTIPNDREAFLNWCYKTKYVCKDDPGSCTPHFRKWGGPQPTI